MSAAKIQLNFNTVFINKTRQELGLSIEEYLIILFIQEQIKNPENRGWCPISKKQISEYLDISEREIYRALAVLHDKGLIEKYEKTSLIRLTSKGYDCLVGIPSAKLAVSTTEEKESTKEKEYINISSPTEKTRVAKKQPTCPLLNGSPLKHLYPNGHQECTEYYLSAEERRGFKFINQSKQFNNIHKILRANFGFKEMSTAISLMETNYGRGNWDFSTLVNWLEKGAARGKS